MKINVYSNISKIRGYSTQRKAKNVDAEKNTECPPAIQVQDFSSVPISAYRPVFGAQPPTKNMSLKIEEEKKKLSRQLKEILDTDIAESAPEDIEAKAQQIASNFFANVEREKERINAQAQMLAENKSLKPIVKYEQIRALEKEYKYYENKLKKGLTLRFEIPLTDEKTDLLLINKFYNAIQENNFNLAEVAEDYYKDLEKISSIKELSTRYPKIKTPDNPREVIAGKFIAVLTKDFFKQIDKYFENKDYDSITLIVAQKIKELMQECLKKTPEKFEDIYTETAIPITQKIMKFYEEAKLNGKIESIPENRKIKIPQITQNDIDLLYVDFDDFVTNVVKEHYLDSKKLNEIIYKKYGQIIKVNSLKNSEYKFSKQPEKIKNFIKIAAKIKQEERDYDKYDINSLKSRLDYYAATAIGNNDRIFDTIIEFATCRFEDEDVKQLKKLLIEFDKIYDKKQTVQEAAAIIYANKIKPLGTQKLTEEARKNAEKLYKQEQKRTALMNTIKKNFDDAINILYMNNLNNLANICSLYRISHLDKDSLQKTRYIIETINKATDKKSKTIKNKALIETTIINWHTFNNYEKNHSDSEIFKKAVNFSKKDTGIIDKIRAGQYLVNYDYIGTYPECLSFYKRPEIIKAIMEKNEDNKDEAVEYLCKYSDYESMSAEDKQKIQNITNLFSLKNPTEKSILKIIIENDYTKTDTRSEVKQGSERVIPTTFTKSAKEQILEKFKFPNCLEYFDGFETAISLFAPSEGATGIKQMGKGNKALKYKIEAKLMGHEGRLFSSENNYIFDIYSSTGLH